MDKFWTKRYPEGIPAEIDADHYASVVTVFAQTCEKYAERPAFANMGRSLTFSELDATSRDLAGYLQKDLKLSKGERVAIMMPNLLQYPVAVFGVLRAGLTAVNVNPLYTPRELEHQLQDAGATTIIIVANFAHVLEEVISRTSVRTVIVTQIGDMLPFPKSLLVNFIVKYVKKMVPAYRLPSAIPLKRALSEGRRLGFDEVDVTGDDLAFLQYTGGTTGVAKGAMLTHRNMVANMEQVSAWLEPSLAPGKEVIITPLPLYHIFCLTANCLCFMKFGGLNVLITNPRDFPAFIAEMEKWPFTAISGVNTLFNALINNEAFARLDFSSLKLSVGGGMAVQKAVAERWQAITGVHMMEGYGLTESSPVVTMNPADLTEHRGSIGLPAPSTEVSIRDDAGVEQPVGGEGELWVRGPQVMRGYWQRPEETAKTITEDGWLMTGDIARFDEEGFVYIVDRKKDMVLVSGFNVYPNEIENVVAMHDAVLEVACIGVPDDKSGEAVKVFVVLKDGVSASEGDIREFCKENLTGYKVPRHVEFRDDLPKSNVGKILRRELRE